MSENSLLLNRADSAVMSRDYALAARLYSTLLKDRPSDLELLKRLGNVYIKSGEDKKAQDIYETLLTLEPKNPDFLLTLGGIYRRIKLYDKSIEVLNKALSAGAKDVQVYYNLGFTYKFQEKFKDAIDCFETVVTLNPNDVLAYNHMGSIYELKKEYDAAIQAYQMGLKVDPNHPILHFNLAHTYESSGNIDGSIREYEAALRYKPGWKEAYVEYARLLFKKGRIKEAENITEQAIKVNGDSARLQSLMGDIYMAEDFYEGAEERYKLSLKSDPKRVKALLGLAKSYEAQGKNADAVDAIQKAKSIAADDDRVTKDSVSINLSAKKMAAANKDLKALMDKDQDDLETLDLAGQYYICSDDENSADSCYKKIESFDPSYKEHLKNASKRYKQKGNMAKAESKIKEYIKQTAPSSSNAYVALAQVEESMGNINDALAAYNRALELGSENKMAKQSSARIASSIGKEAEPLDLGFDMNEDEDLNAGFDETDSVQIDMGQEENIVEEKEEEQEELTTDDFDFDAFGKSPLLEDEPEVDFGDIADSTDKEEEEDEKTNDMDLLGDESTLKDKPEEDETPFDFDSKLPGEDVSGAASTAEEEPAYNSEPAYEPPYEPQPQPQRYEPPRDYPPQNYPPQSYAPDPRADERLRELENANRDLMNKMAQIEDNAKKASDSAEKAWYAAQKAADNAQAIEQSQDELNERMEQMAEEAAKKAAEALEEYKAEKEAEKEVDEKAPEEPQETADDDGLDDLFDDILGTTVPGEEEAEEDVAEDAADKFSDDEESFVDAPASEPAVEDEPVAEEEAVVEEEPVIEEEPAIEEETAVEEEPVIEEETAVEEEAAAPEPEAEPEPEPPTFDSAVQKATEMIPAIENILKKDGSDRDYSAEIKLFKTLRALSESLPESERKEFLQSRTRVTLDYLISKLEGRPGLLKTSHALRKSGALSDFVQEEDVNTDYSQDELARIVVTDMKALAGFLEEDDLVIALNKLADNFLGSQE